MCSFHNRNYKNTLTNLITFVKLHHMILFSGEVLRGDRIVNTLYEVCAVV